MFVEIAVRRLSVNSPVGSCFQVDRPCVHQLLCVLKFYASTVVVGVAVVHHFKRGFGGVFLFPIIPLGGIGPLV